ncbi:putative peptidoglycan binding domain protein [Pseudobythopirellula maris]|uniref:Putative peptidoglycan binding domain protein n=1 Tax=Pseudobythopirellula maris TaxID=2527991 RepID=A0A5C5ZG18_9BACT|nr:peptidoglycan-binding protein [Pseudobythopirellula maris]TWT86166.1 putative peptidoglycan binding domain protein [Pseudobythopirellula maris]
MKTSWMILRPLACVLLAAQGYAADFDFYGRSGDAIEIDLGSLPGVAPGATFSDLVVLGRRERHEALTSSDLSQGDFASDGRFWLAPNPDASSDADPATRGYQGVVSGSLKINGVATTFEVNVRPGSTGAGAGSVGQSLEGLGRTNNPLYVAQQQQRLRYLGYVEDGGSALGVDGVFDDGTDEALRTFQAAFTAGVNTTQANVDGIIGPNTAGWLNAVNAPAWVELVDPDPQTPGSFSVARMIGDFDILPARDPGTGVRSGLTPQSERFGTDWAIDLFTAGAVAAKADTGRTQLMNAMSTDDGYGSAGAHSTHRVGMDIDLHVDSSTWDYGNGVVDAEEQKVIDHAIAFIQAGRERNDYRGSVSRILTSNDDILDGINAFAPGTAVFDSSGVHLNHLHVDIYRPTRVAGLASLAGDFNFDDVVDAADFTVWRDGLGVIYDASDYDLWVANFGVARGASVALAVPEPSALVAAWTATACLLATRRRTVC